MWMCGSVGLCASIGCVYWGIGMGELVVSGEW
jgi:hypothetical protein